jgi:hypothetical protein
MHACASNSDLRDPGGILDKAAATLDFAQPAAVLLLAVLHFLPFSDRFKINICFDLLFHIVNMSAT